MFSRPVTLAVDSPLSFGESYLPPPQKLYEKDHLLMPSFRGINEGRMAAREVDLYLEKSTNLPVTGGIVKRSAQEILSLVAEVK